MTSTCLVNDGIELTAPDEALLLDVLRVGARLPGTKQACGEGDCGSCTVLLGSPDGDATRYRSVCACLVPFADAHGRHVVTVEGLPPFGLAALLIEQGAVQCGSAPRGW